MNAAPPSQPEEPKPKFRRPYKVDLFPFHVQSLVFRGFIHADPYRKIRAAVKQAGFNISENALCRYWRNVWHEQVNRIRKARAYKEVLKEALQLEPSSESARVAEELLYSTVFQMMDYLEQEKPLELLREAREQKKTGDRKKTTRRTALDANQGASLKQRLEQLYGPGVVVEEEVNDEQSPQE